jgi:hypothetical protein
MLPRELERLDLGDVVRDLLIDVFDRRVEYGLAFTHG